MFETFQAEALFAALPAAAAAQSRHYLVLVLDTLGATYQKAGAMALLNSEEVLAGMVSGGCLEAELVFQVERLVSGQLDRADGSGAQRQVLARANTAHKGGSGDGQQICWYPLQYDTRAASDAVLGTALGCKGCLNLALIPLTDVDPFFFQAMQNFFVKSWAAQSGLVGSVAIKEQNALRFSLLESQSFTALGAANAKAEFSLPCGLEQAAFARLGFAPDLNVRVPKRKRICICGAGPDVLPLVYQLVSLGMEVFVVDHRSQYLDELQRKIQAALDFLGLGACRQFSTIALQTAASDQAALREQLLAANRSCTFDGYLIMSHHLQWDAKYLDSLASENLPGYVGLLGPIERRDEVLEQISCPQQVKEMLRCKLKSPVGLAIGARGSAQVALAIAAELVQHFSQKGS